MTDDNSPAPARPAAPAPIPLAHGSYAVFEKPDGGVHLTVRPHGENEERHLDLPGPMVAMAKKMLAGEMPFPGAGIVAKLKGRKTHDD